MREEDCLVIIVLIGIAIFLALATPLAFFFIDRMICYIRKDPPPRRQLHQRNACEPTTAAKMSKPIPIAMEFPVFVGSSNWRLPALQSIYLMG